MGHSEQPRPLFKIANSALFMSVGARAVEIGNAAFDNHSQVKSSHLYLYSAFNNTNCDKATAQYQNGKIVSIM